MLGGSSALVMAILLLGGEPERDIFAAHLALEFRPPLELFASSPADGAEQRLSALDRIGKLVLSYEALDTVTNFSTMIPRLKKADVSKVLLVTSSYHMPRAVAIAHVMLGASGIDFEAHEVESSKPYEPRWKIGRDTWMRYAVAAAVMLHTAWRQHPFAVHRLQ
eukprot:Skav202387  [mRNA]  locus=scaffold1406:391162:393403:- [translate_table: standard]